MNGNRKVPSPWSRESFQLAYLAAFAALGIAPGETMGRRLAELTETAGELIDAVTAMRRASEHQRVFAALDCLTEHRKGDTVPAPAPEES